MLESEAQAFAAKIAATWPQQWVGAATNEVYVEAIMRMHNVDAVQEAVMVLVENEKRLPPIALIRENYMAVLRRPDFQRKLAPPGVEIEGECAYCEGEGWVEIGATTTIMAGGKPFTYEKPMAPCPYCERGRVIEFSSGEFGESGYWQGRESEKAELVPRRTDVSLPMEENARRAKVLLDRIARGNSRTGLAPERTVEEIDADPVSEEALRQANVIMDGALSGTGVVREMP